MAAQKKLDVDQPDPAEVDRELDGRLTALEQQLGPALYTLTRAIDRLVPDRRSLDERMAAVQGELEDVPRRGHADVTTRSGANYSYDYITEADLMKGVRPLLAKHGIATYYRDEIVEQTEGRATVRVWITFAANGEERTVHGDGVGSDFGDKASSKAKTTAVRYLLWKTFLQPSDEDPEQENITADDLAAEQRRRQARSTTSTGPRVDRGRLIQRIATLAVELDEVAGHQPGHQLGKIPALAKEAFGKGYPNDVDEQELVAIGQQLAAHVASERARKESDPDSYAPAEFEIRGRAE